MFDVVTIGTATRDVFIKSPLFKVVRDPEHLERLGFPTGEAQCFALGGKIEIDKPAFMIGGGAANSSVTFARQGFKTAAVMKLGDDSVGDEIVAHLKKERVTPVARRDRKKGTAWSCVLLSPTAERTILNYRGASEDLKYGDIPPGIKARWAYLIPGRIEYSVMRALVRDLKKHGTKIAMDFSKHYLEMGPKMLLPILKNLDVVHINREEASYLTGIKYDDEKKLFKKLDTIIDGIVAMTDGANGVVVSDGKKMYVAGVFREKKLVNRTGAGDAFGSGFVTGLMHYANSAHGRAEDRIAYAIRLGSANATSVVEHIGAQPGILRKGEFEKQSRWKHLPIKIKNM